MIPDAHDRISVHVDTNEHLVCIIREVVVEAYTMLCVWQELSKVLTLLEQLPQDVGIAKFATSMAEFNCRTRMAYDVLQHMLRLSSSCAPNMRRFYLRTDVERDGVKSAHIISRKTRLKVSTNNSFSLCLGAS
jgi:hypothetical protein